MFRLLTLTLLVLISNVSSQPNAVPLTTTLTIDGRAVPVDGTAYLPPHTQAVATWVSDSTLVDSWSCYTTQPGIVFDEISPSSGMGIIWQNGFVTSGGQPLQVTFHRVNEEHPVHIEHVFRCAADPYDNEIEYTSVKWHTGWVYMTYVPLSTQ